MKYLLSNLKYNKNAINNKKSYKLFFHPEKNSWHSIKGYKYKTFKVKSILH